MFRYISCISHFGYIKSFTALFTVTILVQSTFVSLFGVSTFAFNWTIELPLIEELKPCLLP